MSANPTFVQALANATGKPVEVSPVVEATTMGAAFLAGVATGIWTITASEHWHPKEVVAPSAQLDREEWAEAVANDGMDSRALYPRLLDCPAMLPNVKGSRL